MNEFSRSAQERREFERLRYPGSDVLRNKLDLRTQDDLAAAERLHVSSRLAEGLPADARRFDIDGIKAIHRHLFQDVYDWAGNFRQYTTGRTNVPFPRPEFIQPGLDELLTKLGNEGHLVGLEHARFAQRAAYFVNEINAVHPFVEGNGRMQRTWLRQLSEHAGYALDLSRVTRRDWYQASERGFHAVHDHMGALIFRNSSPLVQQRELGRLDDSHSPYDPKDPTPSRPRKRESRSR